MGPRLPRRTVAAVAVTLVLSLSIPAVAQAEAPPLPDPNSDAQPATGLRPGASTPTISFRSGSATPQPGQDRSRLAAPQTVEAPAPPTIALGAVQSTKVSFSWSPGSSGGSPIIGYRVKLTSGGLTLFDVTTDAAEPLSATIDGLDPEATYELSMAASNSAGTSAFSTPSSFTTPFDFIERQFGVDRFGTAARVSYRAFPFYGIPAAFVANGLNFPDALASAAAAGGLGGPVLLTKPADYPSTTAAELAALQPEYVIVSGGSASVNNSVMSAAAQSATVDAFRLAGVDRYGTAEQVAQLWDSASTVYLASGTNFPDALAGAAAAGSQESPVLLTGKDALPASTAAALKRLKPTKIVILGGTGSVSNAVATKAKTSTGVTTAIIRQAGADRYGTAVAVSQAAFPTAGVPVVYVASGTSFSDALAGAAAAGHRGGPVLLTASSAMPAPVIAELKRLDPERVVVLGGPTVVSENVVAQIETALRH